jgi:hypothetical protein
VASATALARQRIQNFAILLMPQYPYESTLVLCTALKWGECTKLAADEVAAAIVRDKQEMAHWGEAEKETVLRERMAQYRTGGEVVGWGGRIPQRIPAEEKLKQAFMVGQSGDESAKKRTAERLYSEFVKENHMDLGTAIHAISNTYIHTYIHTIHTYIRILCRCPLLLSAMLCRSPLLMPPVQSTVPLSLSCI